eukprot:TRINITY_DN5997_c0_g2_i1.p1 TRINITY_DN5997_c0_g2~~TRINITY_DN5997_c0_g2_i1.p1  ORF type:complete len:511 (-),score=99.31 TRINITY_DN5997_c0_g2_i1:165-1697(-)
MATKPEICSTDVLDLEADEFEGDHAEFIRKLKSCNKGVLRVQHRSQTPTAKASEGQISPQDFGEVRINKSWKLVGEPLTPEGSVVYPKMHKLIFDGDYETIRQGFEEGIYTRSDLSEQLNGNTPLFTAVMLCSPEEMNVSRYKIIDLLFKLGSDPLERNGEGWTLLDVAASIRNTYITNIVYKHTRAAKLRLWKSKQEIVAEHLNNLPDFYLEIKWDFRSAFIPFLSRFAPSDTFKIWKMGSSIRLDFSFMGYNEGRAIVSDTSLMMRERYLISDQFRKVELAVLDNKNKALIDPLQNPQEDEIRESVSKILSERVSQGKLKIGQVGWRPSKTMLGNDKVKKIHGRVAQKFKLDFDLEVNTKSLDNCLITESYEEHLKTAVKSLKSVTTQKFNCGLWISKDFPLKLSQLRVIMETLAKHNSSFRKLEEYLGNEAIQKILAIYGFPVRIQVPMGHSIYAVVTFTKFELLEPDVDNYMKTFSIPEDYRLLPRKDAFNYAGSSKNVILANLNI